jgi:outer membrane protein
VGEVTRTDVALAEARLASAEAGLASARGDLLQAEEEYRAATGDAPGQLRTPRNLPRLSGDVEAAKGLAVRKHPDMLQVQKEVLAAELTVGAAEAATRPRITLEGSLGAQDVIGNSDRSHTGRVGVELSGPIYRGGLLSSARRQAMAQRDAKRAELHVVRDAIMRDVGNAYAILRASYAARQAGQEQVRAARVAFRGIRQEATLGARTTLDVLDAEQELLDAQANLISAETDVYIAAYTVLSTIGELTARDLRLNVQLYDPEAYFNLVEDAPVAISPQGEKLDRVLRALGKQ